MTPRAPAILVEVASDGNTLLRERLTRSLCTELSSLDGVEVAFTEPPEETSGGAKSGPVTDLALWVALGAGTTGRIVVECIKAWSARERNRAVKLTRGDQTIEISGNPTAGQERIIEKFFESGDS